MFLQTEYMWKIWSGSCAGLFINSHFKFNIRATPGWHEIKSERKVFGEQYKKQNAADINKKNNQIHDNKAPLNVTPWDQYSHGCHQDWVFTQLWLVHAQYAMPEHWSRCLPKGRRHCLERIHTLKQQVFHVSTQQRLGTTNLKTEGRGQSQRASLDCLFMSFT